VTCDGERRLFFDNLASTGRVLLAAVIAYFALVAMLRVSGKRTLSKLNAFDLVVTVALGSTLSTVTLDRKVPLLDGVAALAALIVLQYVVAFAATRSARADKVVKSEPRVLFYRGEFAREAMRDERITEGAILAAVRQARASDLDHVEAVVLESSGDLSVIRRNPGEAPGSAHARGRLRDRQRGRSRHPDPSRHSGPP
jgi:uncharacterized membrane protein YcaP (DUF421 family)